MCVAIYKPSKTILDKDDLGMAWHENQDGCGFCYRTSGGIAVHRGLWSFEQFWQEYSAYAHKEMLVHFRWATAGKVSRSNCHPIPFNGHALVHNGHMMGYGSKDTSDTVEWTHTALAPLLRDCPHILASDYGQELLENSLGHNMVIVMPHNAPVTILNEALGVWDSNGAWYSNIDYRLQDTEPYLACAVLTENHADATCRRCQCCTAHCLCTILAEHA